MKPNPKLVARLRRLNKSPAGPTFNRNQLDAGRTLWTTINPPPSLYLSNENTVTAPKTLLPPLG